MTAYSSRCKIRRLKIFHIEKGENDFAILLFRFLLVGVEEINLCLQPVFLRQLPAATSAASKPAECLEVIMLLLKCLY